MNSSGVWLREGAQRAEQRYGKFFQKLNDLNNSLLWTKEWVMMSEHAKSTMKKRIQCTESLFRRRCSYWPHFSRGRDAFVDETYSQQLETNFGQLCSFGFTKLVKDAVSENNVSNLEVFIICRIFNMFNMKFERGIENMLFERMFLFIFVSEIIISKHWNIQSQWKHSLVHSHSRRAEGCNWCNECELGSK